MAQQLKMISAFKELFVPGKKKKKIVTAQYNKYLFHHGVHRYKNRTVGVKRKGRILVAVEIWKQYLITQIM